MTDESRRFGAEISPFPPFLKITTNDVGAVFKRRRRSIAQTGPFLIISVDSGLALDTAFHNADGQHPNLWTAHGQAHQLWRLVPSGRDGEVGIVSDSNNLFLDGHGSHNGDLVRMRAGAREPRQRWRLRPAPGGRAHYLENAATGLVLDRPTGAERGVSPQVWSRHSGVNQHWLLVMPFSAPPDHAA
ncbi:RICIN domain-containing protein [Streptomyces sp. NBC_01361]|uniref:RICIN domain-containing protein n=1 Tax=Streptomyces sp. NBC_01361 TaxID=2903838 RepID=UPI002E32B251|nr:RICIN domain-containing protein [Streptomyces sp. NBC_01361]